jgi:hypothetical protein
MSVEEGKGREGWVGCVFHFKQDFEALGRYKCLFLPHNLVLVQTFGTCLVQTIESTCLQKLR